MIWLKSGNDLGCEILACDAEVGTGCSMTYEAKPVFQEPAIELKPAIAVQNLCDESTELSRCTRNAKTSTWNA